GGEPAILDAIAEPPVAVEEALQLGENCVAALTRRQNRVLVDAARLGPDRAVNGVALLTTRGGRAASSPVPLTRVDVVELERFFSRLAPHRTRGDLHALHAGASHQRGAEIAHHARNGGDRTHPMLTFM